MDTTTEENGCMCFVPKSNHGDFIDHEPVEPGCPLITIKGEPPSEFVKCELNPGKARIVVW